ncbi:MAG: Serine hydroxymethyltransferase [Candidatus Collierbacteria bacterium GW2011_GWF2_44_15]|uniref:Serine hydroxymethyltransferase n=3 Tax=Candidatus Collieribacteriota TaxID=1752725 RepID=A0A0G1HFU1_9BACT|nr:MAG: Serine hydroxymethyltransferase [Candidatus Collierbacteria bacterium GW2011_GWF1_44_12]KKT45373.1 MAG: Serine hydroxymethyltransferase [Candidatus Collierbacteria bacterium GW2011_GWF2_44_15]KKU27490.1 MAG: Serine hydroxymethyltransferase [Candidatus Collierbacteria bacterium GW2011_GWE1_46_18]
MQDEVFNLIKEEENRQQETIALIPSENYASMAVREATGCVLANKYAEGYPGRRYYQGNEVVDRVETMAIERCKRLFNLESANVQPYSGSPANTAVLFALLEFGDVVCGMQLSAGGHLTHGHPGITLSGKYFNSVQYGVNRDGRINYEEVAELVKREKPKLIFAGTTAYPFKLDWKKFSEIAESIDAYLVADISHIAGLIVGGVHESPSEYVHIVTSTTHKILRGPRGAFVGVTRKGLEKDPELSRKIDRAVFPGLQGGPHENAIAAMAIAFGEAESDSYLKYTKSVLRNALVLAEEMKKSGLKIFGTENHLMLIDVGKEMGKEVAVRLEEVGIIVNANSIPFDEGKPFRPSGLRIGTPAVSTRGMGESEMKMIASWIVQIVKGEGETEDIKKQVIELCKKFPIPE